MATPDHSKAATKTAGPARHYRVFAHDIEAARPVPGLYLVATPIGNLGDVTLRALEILAGVDVVACEDTRVTHRLFDRYGLTTPLVAYHDHNAAVARPKLLARLDAGDAVALVSDAGTPLISDPGFKLVREAQAAGHTVTAVPGASAVMAAWRAPACRPTGSSSKASCRRGSRRGGRGSPSSPTCRRRWCSSRPVRASPPCSMTSPPRSATARPRCTVNSPSCTRNPPRRSHRPRPRL
jgi:Tetrapyrrole (Corrin/Porphyrin) Methylases